MAKTAKYQEKSISFIEEEILRIKGKRKSKRVALAGAFGVCMVLAIILHFIAYFMLKKLHMVGYRDVPSNIYTLAIMYSLWAYIIVGFLIAWFFIQFRDNRTIQKLKITRIMKKNKERKLKKQK